MLQIRKSKKRNSRPGICARLNGGKENAVRESAFIAVFLYYLKSLQWTILFLSFVGANLQKAMLSRPARNVITKRSTPYQWNGRST